VIILDAISNILMVSYNGDLYSGTVTIGYIQAVDKVNHKEQVCIMIEEAGGVLLFVSHMSMCLN